MKKRFLPACFVITFLLVFFFGGPVYPQEEAPVAEDGGISVEQGVTSPLAEDGGPPGAEPPGGGEETAVTDGAAAGTETETAGTEGEPLSQEQMIIDLDIKTSTLPELANMARSLGLGESGTRDDLIRRLRAHYGISSSGTAAEEAPAKTIIIESARSTDYFTLEVVDEEYARLTGDVRVSLKDKDTVHSIKAWEILYNRTRNVMYASGGVEYKKEEGDTLETFRGESMVIDIDNWSGSFMTGLSERSISGEETAYRFDGEIISRTAEETTILKKATISNPKQDENYWSIKASRVWLLPGSDFAILNAILKVGEIPVLYIPFFFFPADEVIFHPVLGSRPREGMFLQTTTYILGRPKADPNSESSISKILGNNKDMERERNGIFLRSTGKKSRDPNDTKLSMIFDAYSNLGTYFGTELALPKKGIFGGTELSMGIGVTRDVTQQGGNYTPYIEANDMKSVWNTSRFFDEEIPFRYRFKSTGSLSGSMANFTWDFPFYSDPFVERDFMNRSEEMDYAKMLSGGSSVDAEEALEENLLSAYEWRVNLSSQPSLPALRPYISSLSISTMSSFVSFKTRDSKLFTSPGSPQKQFFYPDKFTLFSLSAGIAGELFSFGSRERRDTTPAGSAAAAETEESPGDPLLHVGLPRLPWDSPKELEENNAAAGTVESLVPPELSHTFALPGGLFGPNLTLGYRFDPSASSELQFRSSQPNWPELEDVSYEDVSSILTTLRANGSTTLGINDDSGLYSSSLTLSGMATWQDYNYMNEESEDFDTETEQDAAKLRNYNSTYFSTFSEFSTTLRPFFFSPVWGSSSVQYTFKNLLMKSAFSETASAAAPSWDIIYGKWEKEDLEIHKVTANAAANVMDYTQNVSLALDLPPRDSSLTGNAGFNVWRTHTTINTRIDDPFGDGDDEDGDAREYTPITFTETVDLGKKNSGYALRYSMIYDPNPDPDSDIEKGELSSVTAGLSFYGLQASFSAARSVPYILVPNVGWQIDTAQTESLRARDLRLSYRFNLKEDRLFRGRIGYSVDANTDFTLDLQRYTYSSLTFSLNCTLRINKFLDVSFATRSANNVVFRYIQHLPFFDMPVELPGEKNIFTDLVNSFRFDKEELRQSSGFKLKDLSFSMTHYLGDWNVKLGVLLAPYLDQNEYPFKYKFNTEVSLLIQWIPISEFKTEVRYNGRYEENERFQFL